MKVFLMPSPSHYYLLSETSQQSYNSTPMNSVSLDVSRFIQNKACWRMPFGSSTLKKKTLIINDIKARNWNNEQRIIAAERFQQLQTEGFKIYALQNGQLERFDLGRLIEPESAFEGSKMEDKTIAKLAVDLLHLSHDDLLVLNHQELDLLMQGNDQDWSQLDYFEKINLHHSNISSQSLSHLLQKKGQQIKSLKFSGCVNLKEDITFNNLELDSLEEFIISDSKELVFVPALSNTVKLKRKTNLTTLSMVQIIRSSPNLKVLRLPEIDNNIDSLLSGLKQPSNLEVLDLSNCNFSGELLNDIDLNNLKTLQLNGSNISINSLGHLLAKT
ncbi:MAG: hypothetical protein HYX60_11730, partial [Legionella longbeachae]|nr:hypothetical protein [Legionella longbeachae]